MDADGSEYCYCKLCYHAVKKKNEDKYLDNSNDDDIPNAINKVLSLDKNAEIFGRISKVGDLEVDEVIHNQ